MQNGSFHIMRLFGISVWLHWSWLVLAAYEVWSTSRYSARLWNFLEFAAIFAIVLVHEFGHALAARSVGGRAEQIVLWPLGGIAFVQVPPRPGANLWTTAAGPLVNVALVPIIAWVALGLGLPLATGGLSAQAILAAPLTLLQANLAFISGAESLISPAIDALFDHLRSQTGDLHRFLFWMSLLNLLLLVFNLIPAYPLDGGRIFQSLLWFVVGRVPSLVIAGFVGLVFAAAAMLYAISIGAVMLAFVALFIGLQAWQAFTTRSIPEAAAVGPPAP